MLLAALYDASMLSGVDFTAVGRKVDALLITYMIMTICVDHDTGKKLASMYTAGK